MATFTFSITNEGLGIANWDNLTNTEAGTGAKIGHYPDKTVQVVGTFSTGGQVTIEGSNDGGSTWGVLHDPQGTDLIIDAGAGENDLAVISESPELIRPNVTGGDGSTDVDVFITAVARD